MALITADEIKFTMCGYIQQLLATRKTQDIPSKKLMRQIRMPKYGCPNAHVQIRMPKYACLNT